MRKRKGVASDRTKYDGPMDFFSLRNSYDSMSLRWIAPWNLVTNHKVKNLNYKINTRVTRCQNMFSDWYKRAAIPCHGEVSPTSGPISYMYWSNWTQSGTYYEVCTQPLFNVSLISLCPLVSKPPGIYETAYLFPASNLNQSWSLSYQLASKNKRREASSSDDHRSDINNNCWVS